MSIELNTRRGWGIAIRRDDGTEFLASSGHGILPAIWIRSQRKYAVQHKRELIAEGFVARVALVLFATPEIA